VSIAESFVFLVIMTIIDVKINRSATLADFTFHDVMTALYDNYYERCTSISLGKQHKVTS
jgi:hypothetical protein